jgi:hypothetical protein
MEYKMLISDGKNYYPTPPDVVNKMLNGVDFKHIENILEPSAGAGNIADIVKERIKSYNLNNYTHKNENNIDCVEIDPVLKATLKGKGFRVVHDDFLTFDTFKKYDLIIMNPPFDEGDRHLLKALELQKDGGAIICLLNAETLKNPYSSTRKDLIRKLNELSAQVQYLDGAFAQAERKTNVEVALVKAYIPKLQRDSEFFSRMEKAQQLHDEQQDPESRDILPADFIKGLIHQFKVEAAAGVALINEYCAMKPLMLIDLATQIKGKESNATLLTLNLKDGDISVNGYLRAVRYKYWYALFHNDNFIGRLTENLRKEYFAEVEKMSDYEFSLHNILTIQEDMMKSVVKGVQDTVIALFEELSNKYCWYDEMSDNIHYYNGWKTNKAYKINKKVIIPLNGWCSWWNRLDLTYTVSGKISDMVKVFDYLDNGRTEAVDVRQFLQYAQDRNMSRKIPIKYFNITFYKKGTCHIEFTDLEILEKFNLYGSQQKGWLPPTYGRKRYSDMSDEEKTIVKEFSGSVEEYNKVLENQDIYIVNEQLLLQAP